VLHAATDHPGYAEQIAEVGDAEPRLTRVGPDRGELAISVVRPSTKYESKAQHAGSAVTELVWESRSERNRP
jgi:tRNA (guanine-N7-)-methyltransferase